MKRNFFAKIFLMILIYLIFSCAYKEGTKKFGVTIPKDLEVIKLEDILKEPNKYDGKKVLIEGNIVAVCASGCDFRLQEGTSVVDIYPFNFKVLGLRSGSKARVYSEIKSGKERVVISALGMEVKEK
ncbi:MAG: hypothetical protein RMJ13_06955 [Elusimicrobiota bacterium]|nr:hypothetical protein [Elusimicrobiota bacterium]